MDLLIEDVDFNLVESELIESETTGKKELYISGIFLQSDLKNQNGRIYPEQIMSREVNRLYESKIVNSRLVGELDHPTTSGINLDRVSHLITELKMDGKNGFGKAKIIPTPCGNIAKSLIESGFKIGISSRALGTVKNGIVQNDLRLITADLVADPSAPEAMMNSIYENKEWILENGVLTEKEIEEITDTQDTIVIENKFSVEEKRAAFLKLFNDVMKSIGKK